MLTQVFERGDSIAVPIPKELAFAQALCDVDVQRVGDTWVIRPVHAATLANLGEVLAAFPPGFMAQGRETHEQDDRVWDEPVAPEQPA
jgi:antitoxin VapB